MVETVGVIGEGVTDQIVIESILLGHFGKDVLDIQYTQPQLQAPGGWTVLFKYLRDGGPREVLQFRDVVVIHVDTDVCDHVGFGVPRTGDSLGLIAAVRARLIREMGPGFEEYAERVWFAIAVDSVECWLLPLLSSKATEAGKITGCLKRADTLLRKKNDPTLSKGDSKQVDSYAEVAKGFHKPKNLAKAAKKQVSLGAFVAQLGAGGSE